MLCAFLLLQVLAVQFSCCFSQDETDFSDTSLKPKTLQEETSTLSSETTNSNLGNGSKIMEVIAPIEITRTTENALTNSANTDSENSIYYPAVNSMKPTASPSLHPFSEQGISTSFSSTQDYRATNAFSDIPGTQNIEATKNYESVAAEVNSTQDTLKHDPFGNKAGCEISPDPDSLTQDQFSSQLTNGCRYDRLIKPSTEGPLNVSMQVDIRHIEAMEQLQFKMHMLVQYSYTDKRLNYSSISPKRGHMIGEDRLRDKIWVPHIVLSNERDTSIMGLQGKDVYVSISPIGEVIYSYRMTALIYCWMDLKKFPFDEQVCDIYFKSWIYNASYVMLHWDKIDPVMVAMQLHLTEFKLTNHWTSSMLIPGTFSRGAFVGNFSNLIFKFQITREIGFYVMDYFLPSIMLVCTSWVTFWLQADNAAPRIALGTSTMLSFITLASGQSKTLPKVSYIKASEIWFLGCTMFIFASIAEFAFVNIIWRRKKRVELIKPSSKYILQNAITPKLARRELQKSSSMNDLRRAKSFTSLTNAVNAEKQQENGRGGHDNYLTVHSFHSCTVPTITMQSEDDLIPRKNSYTSVAMPPGAADAEPSPNWTTMTPQEIAMWIDRRSRLVFPSAFIVFNLFYWSFVYAL